ncbi:hypothetical protein [Brevundimonas sp. Leaf168]|uniref:hypothetical protein n=1 Tax=Brevundimonas sp. Leaf168 TaxID=1736283 RepID=UPI0006FA47E1|nr:hypothetical protein [Brevundimonas sp. Leaf168]KQR55857.1 hypothetical protein ASF81_08855 [Brevundimonas sp. Leaf168]
MMRLVDHPDERLALARGGQAYVERVHSPASRAAELDALREALVDTAFVTPQPTLRRRPPFGPAASLTRLQG